MTNRLHSLTDGAEVVKRTHRGLIPASAREIRRELQRQSRKAQGRARKQQKK